MKVLLIRHGKTKGNLECRYVGRTDESLLESEKASLKTSAYRKFKPDIVYCSRMLRCRQTAEVLFGETAGSQTERDWDAKARPVKERTAEKKTETKKAETKNAETEEAEREKTEKNRLLRIRGGLEETDFGEFEYKNYDELNSDPAYQAWIDSGGRLAFPGGESGSDFRRRCCRAFLECVQDAKQHGADRIAFVVHGGTIMSILEAYAEPKADFYHWQVKNGEGFLTELVCGETGNISLRITEEEL